MRLDIVGHPNNLGAQQTLRGEGKERAANTGITLQTTRLGKRDFWPMDHDDVMASQDRRRRELSNHRTALAKSIGEET
jgi:hypothetical protein